ncbi:ABC-type polysaccharide/polyol phosphate export system, permease component [Leptolyngbyaceae cyanobacterium JSC-12]|nr:ABC-type polysaccharide/polyol phosphate export system, permease component [Leptolyngbyaceae cyanobacterium JSC-12]
MSKSFRSIIRTFWKFSRWLPISSAGWTKLDLLKTLVQRDLEARYKGSILGNFWSLLNQLSQLLVYTYVFSVVLKVKLNLNGLPSNSFTFGLWLFAGLISWIAFTSGFTQAATSVVSQPNLVKKLVFPLTLLPLVPICSAFLESLFGLILLITFVAFTSQTVHSTVFLLPLIWMPQLLFTAGLGYLVAALTVFIRDIPQTIVILLNLWFYVTPIIYPSSAIPESFRFWVLWLNPLATLVETYRDLILIGEVRHLAEWGLFWGVAIAVFYGGLGIYRRLRSAFADVL